jgi:hypothetical protein
MATEKKLTRSQKRLLNKPAVKNAKGGEEADGTLAQAPPVSYLTSPDIIKRQVRLRLTRLLSSLL